MPSIFKRAIAVTRTRLEAARERRGLPVPVGSVDFGSLQRTEPISRMFGLDRGVPIDRYYMERFLRQSSSAIHGHVLEIAERTYTERFGGSRVTKSDVLHLTGESPATTIVADLTSATSIGDDTFDCIVLTQTLQFIFDIQAAISELHRILKPGGCVLATATGISQISRYDADRWGDYWRLTDQSARRLFERYFRSEDVHVTTYGNVLAATSFLEGLATSELSRAELDVQDDDYQLVIGIKAVKACR